jgi:hypothetical protein
MVAATFVTFEKTKITIDVKNIFMLSPSSGKVKYIFVTAENGITHTFPFDENKDNPDIPPKLLSSIHQDALNIEHGKPLKMKSKAL